MTRPAHRHRGRWGPLPVWPQLFGGQCGAARGGLEDCQPLAEGNERHQAARTALIAIDRRSRAAIALDRLSPSHRAARDRRSTASTAARLGARSANLGQTAHYSQAIAHFVDRRSRTDRVGPVGRPRTEKKTATPPESSGDQVAGDDAQRGQHAGAEPAPRTARGSGSSRSRRCWTSPTTAPRHPGCRCRPPPSVAST